MRQILFIFVAVTLNLSAASASAQGIPCAPRETLLRFIIDQRGESRQASGVAGRGAQMALFASEAGSWTMVLFLPDGRACLLAHGDAFQATGGLQPARGTPI